MANDIRLLMPVVEHKGDSIIKKCPCYDKPFRVDYYPNNCRTSTALDREIIKESCPYNTFQLVEKAELQKYKKYYEPGPEEKEKVIRWQLCKFPKNFFQMNLFGK